VYDDEEGEEEECDGVATGTSSCVVIGDSVAEEEAGTSDGVGSVLMVLVMVSGTVSTLSSDVTVK
jgi:hypothetical protein